MRKALLLRLIAIMMAMGALCGCGDDDSDRPLGGVRKELKCSAGFSYLGVLGGCHAGLLAEDGLEI